MECNMEKTIVEFPGEELDMNTGKYKYIKGSVEKFTNDGNSAIVLSLDTKKFYKVYISDLKFIERR